MKKRIIAVILVIAVMAMTACSGKESEKNDDNQVTTTPEVTAEATKPAEKEETKQETTPEPTSVEEVTGTEDEPEVTDAPEDTDKAPAAFKMSVNNSDGKLSISRAMKKSNAMGDEGTWTIFVYLCGTDLESSGQGSATSDLQQMLEGEGSDNVRFVLQTGGTSEWMNEAFDASVAERWVVQNNDVQLADSVELGNMGDPDTLYEFLSWGVENFPAEKMGVVFWNHGSGSINGACFDELNDSDSLSLAEINAALSAVYENMDDKFEFIGFDCCLMGTLETANMLATYARYFYGSQETEPGSGWDYTSIANFLAENTGADGGELGKVITDSFYDECAQAEQENECTFTIVDLEKIDDFTVAFNDFSKELYESADSNLAGIVRNINAADNFGGNNKAEGYTNMVDIGGIINNCSDYADGSAALSALEECIVYNKNGSNHSDASGLSIYFPLKVEGSNELGIFSGVCPSPYYLSLVDMIAKGYSEDGYDNSGLFSDDGSWTSENCQCEDISEDYFEDDDEEDDEDSKLITFEQAPVVSEEGSYWFQLDASGLEYASSVEAFVYMDVGAENVVELGETFDIQSDWENGLFVDNFDGSWLALPDGQLLATYVVDASEDSIVYTSPIYLNGKRTNLRIVQDSEGVYIEGAWDGIDENGIAAREIKKISAGDTIAPMYYLDDDSEYTASEYEWEEGDSIIYSSLPEASYYYCFLVEDVYGDYFISDFVIFNIDGEGNISFEE